MLWPWRTRAAISALVGCFLCGTRGVLRVALRRSMGKSASCPFILDALKDGTPEPVLSRA